MEKKIITMGIEGNDIEAEVSKKLKMLLKANEGQLEYFAGIHKKCIAPHLHIAVMAERDIKIPLDGMSVTGVVDVSSRNTDDIERYVSRDAEEKIKSRHWPA